MSADVYSKLLMALVMPDQQETSCYPVRVSAAGAITTLLEVSFQFSDLFWTGFFCSFFSFTKPVSFNEIRLLLLFSLSLPIFCVAFQNDYMPPDFLPLLQVIVSSIGIDESESSILFQLLSSIMEAADDKVAVHIPHIVSPLVGSVSKWFTASLGPWPQVRTDPG